MNKTQTTVDGAPRRARLLSRLLGRFRRNEKGATAIEFAIVATPFLALLIAIFETTLIFFTQSALETGVANAGRLIRTGQAQTQGISEAAFKTAICDSLAGYLDCQNKLTVDVRSFDNFGGITLPPALDEDGELNGGTAFSPGGTSQVVVVRAFYVWDMITPDHITGLSNMPDGKRLIAAASAFRNEPF